MLLVPPHQGGDTGVSSISSQEGGPSMGPSLEPVMHHLNLEDRVDW